MPLRTTTNTVRSFARSRAPQVTRRGRTLVEILEDGRHGDREGLIETVHRRSSEVDIRVLLDDGTPALAVLSHVDADWLDLRGGDIVFVDVASA